MFRRRPAREPANPELADIIHKNIDALSEIRRRHEAEKSGEEKLGDSITGFFGSLRFFRLGVLFLAGWVGVNVLPLGLAHFDPYPFPFLAALTSAAALFISVFVLIRQNSMAKMSERRADLDLQISLLSEHEITKLIRLVDSLVQHSGAPRTHDATLESLKTDVAPEKLIERIEQAEKNSAR